VIITRKGENVLYFHRTNKRNNELKEEEHQLPSRSSEEGGHSHFAAASPNRTATIWGPP
jgi:hypothetical protein